MLQETDTATVVSLLERQNEFLRLMARPVAAEAARSRLNGSNERAVYGLADGTRSSRQIETETGVSKSTVARWLRDWRAVGLLVETDKGNARAVFPIEELELPALESERGGTSSRRRRKAR